MSDLVKQLKSVAEGKIDFAGQARAERTNQQILIFSGVLAFVAGFSLQSLRLCMAIYVLGCLACAVAIGPQWPHFRRQPIDWLPALPDEDAGVAPGSAAIRKQQ